MSSLEQTISAPAYRPSWRRCKYCVDLTFGCLERAFSGYQHHPTFASLQHAVAAGCELCSLFQQALLDEYTSRLDWSESKAVAFQVSLDNGPRGGFQANATTKEFANAHQFEPRAKVGILYERRKARWGTTWDFEWEGSEESVDDMSYSGMLMIASVEGTDGDFVGCAISAYPDLEICSEWMRQCSTEHEGCDPIKERLLPTRLIDVEAADSPDRLCLVQTGGQYGQYVTLSRCWGGHNPPVTDSESYWTYLRGIAFDSLPRTFQDAVKTTRLLRIRYLWIDCFCIIQGDKIDWQRECANMERIFANSRVTITGPAAANPDAGLLHSRPDPPVAPCEILRSTQMSNERFDLLVSLPVQQDWRYNAPVEKNPPLANRAWIVQERFLSPRVLYFGSDQLYYECNTYTNFECYRKPVHFKDTGDTGDPARNALTKDMLSFTGEVFQEIEADPEALVQIWYSLISTYSACKLTDPRDKLPALSGLAKRFADRNNDMYLAGLWRRDLIQGLSWCPRFFHRRQTAYTDYVGPSWSWTSFNGPVGWSFPAIEKMNEKSLVHVINGKFPRMPCCILDARCEVDGLDPYGRVRVGGLKLSCLSKTFIVDIKDSDMGGHQVLLRDPTYHPHGTIILYLDQLTDGEYISVFGKYAKCILLGFWRVDIDSKRSNYGWTALAVMHEDGSSVECRRLGIVVNNDTPGERKWCKSPWVSARQESLTLI